MTLREWYNDHKKEVEGWKNRYSILCKTAIAQRQYVAFDELPEGDEYWGYHVCKVSNNSDYTITVFIESMLP